MRPTSREAVDSEFSSKGISAPESGEVNHSRPFLLRYIDHRDTAVLKGLAISAIVFHNFFHAVSPVQENEFTFAASRFREFIETIVHPALAIQALFAFFGHFGVELFIFLSAYGLTKSHWNDTASWSGFMWGRIRKLYPKFGLVILPWAIASCVAMGPGLSPQISGFGA